MEKRILLTEVTIKDIADALNININSANKRATRNKWNYEKKSVRGGKQRIYQLNDLPEEIKTALLLRHLENNPPEPSPYQEKMVNAVKKTVTRTIEFEEIVDPEQPEISGEFLYEPEALWKWADFKTEKSRNKGQQKAEYLNQAMLLHNDGMPLSKAFGEVAKTNGISKANLKNWYYGVNGNIGAKLYRQKDWPAALIAGHKGRTATAPMSSESWRCFLGLYLHKRKRSINNCYRITSEIGEKEGWAVPSVKAFRARLKREVFETSIILAREGMEALNEKMLKQTRDRTCFAAGQAVSGDGLKFDKIYVDFGDEIINTMTGWFWFDMRTNFIAAYRLAKTENTDLFRLATYDLLKRSVPFLAQIDNTRVAANKLMTGQSPGRRRFLNKETDPLGLLQKVGIEPQFTNPDKKRSTAGSKIAERNFGIGGIHSEVASNPKLKGRGYSKKTAIPFKEIAEIIKQEVHRHNNRPNRQTDVCRGTLSFKQAYDESFSSSEVRLATKSQYDLFLLIQERVFVNKQEGYVAINAGKMGNNKNRYWDEALDRYRGQYVIVFFDPEDLTKDACVYQEDGKKICNAEHIPSVAFNDTTSGREWNKRKARIQKAEKKNLEEHNRMNDMELAALYEKVEVPEDIETPEPGIVGINFKNKNKVIDGELVTDESSSNDSFSDDNFTDRMLEMREKWQG